MKRYFFPICFLVCLFLLDFFVFRKWQFEIPNETAWNTNHFFQFLYEFKQWENKPKTKPRIVIVGSSVAYFSFDAFQLKSELKDKFGLDVDVIYLTYAGNSPMYVYLLWEKLKALQPDFILYPINFIDYRLHRTYVLFPEGRNDNAPEELLVRDALTFEEAPQSLWIFPRETLLEVGKHMDWNTRSKYLLASMFSFYQTKDIVWNNWSALYQHRFGRNTSYHAYMGYPVPERVNAMGWTGQTFSFPWTNKIQNQGFWIEVPPALVPTTLTIRQGEIQKEIALTKVGWQKIVANGAGFKERELVQARLGRVWFAPEAKGTYLDYHWDPMGVRLEQTFALEEPPSGKQFTREPRTEDFRYETMSDSEYERYFHFRLLEGLEKRPGIAYLLALKKAKNRIRKEQFLPSFHFRYLRKFTEACKKAGLPLLLINNPENPISLAWYEKSTWYAEHLQFLESLAGGSVVFWDLHNRLRAQGFSDFHHFTYSGMLQMNPIYAERIGNLFPK